MRLKAEDTHESKSKCNGDLVELRSTYIVLSSASIALFSVGITLDMVYVSIVLR